MRVVGRGFVVGRKPPLAAERRVSVVGADGVLGRVVGEVPLDGKLAAVLRTRSGLAARDRLVVVDPVGRIVGRPAELLGSRLRPERTRTVRVGEHPYRALEAKPLPFSHGATLAVLAPKAEIDAADAQRREPAARSACSRSLLLIALVAYLDGRSIVRTLAPPRRRRERDRPRRASASASRSRAATSSRGSAARSTTMANQLEARLEELERRARAPPRRDRRASARRSPPRTTSDQLLRVVVETAVEATGAAGGLLVADDGRDRRRRGDPDAGGERLELPLAAGRDELRHAHPRRPRLRRRAAR